MNESLVFYAVGWRWRLNCKKLNDFLFQLKQRYISTSIIFEYQFSFKHFQFSFSNMSFISGYSDNVNLFGFSLQELYRLFDSYLFTCEGIGTRIDENSFPYPQGTQLFVHMKTLEHIAQQAFAYSLKVRSLQEVHYHSLVEWLDDILLEQSRMNIHSKVSSFGYMMSEQYQQILDIMGLIDERLKTISIVCENSRSRRYKVHKPKSSCWVDENGFRVRTPPNRMETVSATAYDVPFTPPVQEQAPEPVPLPAEYIQFRQTVKQFLQIASQVNRQQPDTNECLINQCQNIEQLYNYIIDNIEYISNESQFRKYQKSGGDSFMQVCIRKCVNIAEEINRKYDRLRKVNVRSDPTMRSAKISALATVENAKNILCKYYIERPVEKETVEFLLTHPK